jgi:hypothetical protein
MAGRTGFLLFILAVCWKGTPPVKLEAKYFLWKIQDGEIATEAEKRRI